MSETPFDPLNDALNVDYNSDELVRKAEKDVKKFTEVSTKIGDTETLQDKEYMEMELKTLIQSMRYVMDTLEEDAKVGAKPRVFEVYATMAKAVLDAVKELRDLHMSIENLKINKAKLEIKRNSNELPPGAPQVNLKLTGKELFKMVSEAQESASETKTKIEAEYKVEE
jgi:hypothetical protein